MRTFQIYITDRGREHKYTFSEDTRGDVKIHVGDNGYGGVFLPKTVVDQLKAFLLHTTGSPT